MEEQEKNKSAIQLNRQQEQFVEEYFKQGLNATKAYQVVYNCSYENANSNAVRLMVNDGIQSHIQKKYSELQQRHNVEIDEIIFKVKKLIEDCENDSDRKNLIKGIDLLNKMLGHYAPIKTENVGAVPLVINYIKPQ